MRIFGTLLPFIGFRTFPVRGDGSPILPGERGVDSGYETDVLSIEWLWVGIYLLSVGVRKDETSN